MNIFDKRPIIVFQKFIFLFFAFLCLCGCTSFQDSQTWKQTKKLYYNYINTPVELEYDETLNISQAKEVLVDSLMKIDKTFTSFKHAFEHLPLPPNNVVLDEFFKKFPWLSGMALINPKGEVTGAFPENYPKPLDFAKLLDVPQNKTPRDIRVVVQEDPMGAEVLMGRPAFDPKGQFIGVFIVYFDMKSLLSYVNANPAIFVLAGNVPVWTGDYLISETPLAGIDFAKETRSDNSGENSNKYGSAIWISQYLYHQPFVFAVMQE